ncbi:MAG TPA: glycosyltransferase, partial [Euzebyales bacterium]|nr:glycosyltransferase [Euzebyales bacterium]
MSSAEAPRASRAGKAPDGLRLVISGGGTAGHVYPALALLDSWPHPEPRVTWIGTPDGMERSIVTAAGIPFEGVRSGAVRGQRADRLARSLTLVAAGAAQASAILFRTQPDVVLTTGGYVSVPVAAASRL